jgi:adhesin HecA-like repeat protein
MGKVLCKEYLYTTVHLLLFCCLLLPVISRSGTPSDLFRLVEAGSLLNTQGLSSGQGYVTVTTRELDNLDSVTELTQVLHVRFKDEYCIADVVTLYTVIEPGPTVDPKLLVSPGSLKQFTILYTPTIALAYYQENKIAYIRQNKYDLEMMAFRNIRPQSIGFWQFTEKKDSTHTEKKVEIDGRNYIQIESEFRYPDLPKNDMMKYISLVDPQKGFTPIKILEYAKSDKFPEYVLVDEYELDTKEYADGIWGPKECKHTAYRLNADGQLRKAEITTIKYAYDFQFAIPVKMDELSIEVPSGVTVIDTLLREQTKLTTSKTFR